MAGADRDLKPWPVSGRATTADGVPIAYYELGGAGVPLVLAHATGFCGPVLAPLAAPLATEFRCIALDERAHGASGAPPDGNLDWHGFAADVLAVVDHLGLEHARGFGHSCGGAALLLAEQARPGTFDALYCYEPVIFPGEVPLAPALEGNPLSAGALRRRAVFATRRDALANFCSKPPFDRLDPEVLDAYIDNGFVAAGGSITLRCRREHEALVYAHGFSHDASARLAEIACPVTLSCGADTDAFGPDFLALFAARLTSPTTVVLPGLGHFGPLEDPAVVAASVRAALVRGGDTPGA
jgi:pimeloyl-ACP methyl ester carboxylesterase